MRSQLEVHWLCVSAYLAVLDPRQPASVDGTPGPKGAIKQVPLPHSSALSLISLGAPNEWVWLG